jgi:hypothetical protein
MVVSSSSGEITAVPKACSGELPFRVMILMR